MKDDKKEVGTDRGKDARQDRLKLALRENLKRRKSQARGRGDAKPASSNVDALSSADVPNNPRK
jgi:hypothetical protein